MNCDLLITHCAGLVQVRDSIAGPLRGKEMSHLPVLADAFLVIADGRIVDYGPMSRLPDGIHAIRHLRADGCYIFPSFVDCHTHLVFPRSREEEFVMKIRGATYAEIAARGGGILNSAKILQRMSEDELLERSLPRAREIICTGTGAVEIKSGYGLTLRDELKMLRVARRIASETPLAVRTTFLGAHAVPEGYTKSQYVDILINEMIPAVADGQLAEYIDVFCETGFFTPDETEKIVQAGLLHGLKPRLHANQFGISGGVQVGVRTGAISVDHLEYLDDEEITLLRSSNTMPVALPGAAFFLGLPQAPGRKMLEAGLPLAIASDYNPGSSPSGNMPLIIALACILMKLTPEEAINAATVNAACALELQDRYGCIARGREANLFITRPMPSVAYLPYAYGSHLVDKVILQGRLLEMD